MKHGLGVLCSGMLGLNCLRHISLQNKVQFIFTDSKSAGIIEFAHQNEIPLYIGNPRNEKAIAFIRQFKTDVILSVNYLFIVQQEIVEHAKLYAINFHGSLLPKYRGRTPHVWAIINGESETGITAHEMGKGCDTGNILLQQRIKIEPSFTGNDILDKYNEAYPGMIDEILDSINNNTLQPLRQIEENATYFGKRTPNDGLIDWNWQKERIYNWVRAQSYPYPGAFSNLNGSKITIDKISFTDWGYSNDMPNGLIVRVEPDILVKTPNGVIKLDIVRNKDEIAFLENDQMD